MIDDLLSECQTHGLKLKARVIILPEAHKYFDPITGKNKAEDSSSEDEAAEEEEEEVVVLEEIASSTGTGMGIGVLPNPIVDIRDHEEKIDDYPEGDSDSDSDSD